MAMDLHFFATKSVENFCVTACWDMRHSNIAVLVTHKTLNGKIIFFTAKPPLSNQDKAMENCTRLKVTTCLYRGPIINARSLSTFISVIVSKDAPTNSVDVNMDASRRWTQWFECSENHLHSLYVTCNGWVMRPIHKSEHAHTHTHTHTHARTHTHTHTHTQGHLGELSMVDDSKKPFLEPQW